MSDIVITELEEFEPDRVDGVKGAASGFPILLMKSISKDANGTVNAESGTPSTVGMVCNCCPDCLCTGHDDPTLTFQAVKAEQDVYKRDVSTSERKKLASEGKALSDGSYPIANKGDLDNAASLARSGHGNASAAKKLIARRAKELGVANPLDDHDNDDAKKGDVTEETPAAEEPQAEAFTKADVENLIKAAVTEATKATEELVKALGARVAKVEEMPIPGGPVLTAPARVRAERARDEALAKAAKWERLAEQSNEPEMRKEYRDRAAAAREAAGVTT